MEDVDQVDAIRGEGYKLGRLGFGPAADRLADVGGRIVSAEFFQFFRHALDCVLRGPVFFQNLGHAVEYRDADRDGQEEKEVVHRRVKLPDLEVIEKTE